MTTSAQRDLADVIAIPDDYPEYESFISGVADVHEVIEKLGLSTEVTKQPAQGETKKPRGSREFLRGAWTTCATYCLIAWPLTKKSHHEKLLALKKLLTEAHLRIHFQMEDGVKHYQSRLIESFLAYRTLVNHPDWRPYYVPSPAGKTADEFLIDLQHASTDQNNNKTLNELRRAFEAALEASGGHARSQSPTSDEDIVETLSVAIESDEETTGALEQDVLRLNDPKLLNSIGLSRDEAGSGPLHYRSSHDVEHAEGESVAAVVFRRRHTATHIARANQLLPHDINQLSLQDFYQCVQALPTAAKHVAKQLLIKTDEIMAFVTLCFLLSRPANYVRTIRMLPGRRALTDSINGPALLHDSWTMVIPAYHPEQSRRTKQKWEAYARPTQDRVYLPLPGFAHRLLSPYVTRISRSGNNPEVLFDKPAAVYNRVPDETVAELKILTGSRITVKRLYRQLALTLANDCGDLTLASAVLGQPIGGLRLPGLYYLAANQTTLAKLYWSCTTRISLIIDRQVGRFPGIPTKVDRLTGSQVRPQRLFLEDYVSDLRNAVIHYRKYRLRRSRHLTDFHNAFTLYCLNMVCAMTGYRTVKDPFHRFDALDPVTGLLIISDKDFDDYHAARLVWVPDLVVKQLQIYQTWRMRLTRLLDLSATLPFFYLVTTDRKAKRLSVREHERAIAWTWKLPLNAMRHELRSYLTEAAVPGEVIDAFMGHAAYGQEAFGPYSGISPTKYCETLRKPLETLLKQMGWTLIQP